ncbi:MAG: hypothetical protein KDA24_03715 [Deltaproteobacteria bacterium]|nr:hypothetical protein [Deltaproteobacteria bacterium]
MSRSVLVTGATTPLGVAFVNSLLADPEVSNVLALGVEERPAALVEHPELTYARSDLRRPRHIRRLLSGPVRELGIDTIVHTALHRSARDEGGAIHKLNVESTRLLLRLAAASEHIKHFVYRSDATVYRVRVSAPQVLREDHALELTPDAPQWVRDRVEGDVIVCTHMGLVDLRIMVLRCAEILAPNMGSQLADWLGSRMTLRPMGFDPMVNLLSLGDASEAMRLAVHSDKQAILNVPGADTLPISRVAERNGRRCVDVPGPLMGPLYRLRGRARKGDFRYDLNHNRFHFSMVLDGRRASEVLGYQPSHPLQWPAVPAIRG